MHSHTHDVTLGLAFLLGAMHAIEPGHGKTAMLVYLSTEKRSFWHPVVMGISSAVAHSVSLLAIALAVHLAQHWVVGDHSRHDEVVSHSLQWVSAILDLAVGVWMWRSAAKKVPPKCGCKAHRRKGENVPQATPSSYSMSALLGVAFGLLPCPSALAAYFASMSLGAPMSAYAVIGLFAAGIACSLSLVGILLQWLGAKSLPNSKYLADLPWPYIRASLILGIGSFYMIRLAVS
jgi:nickel/cobalt transporter (NicO) family protein